MLQKCDKGENAICSRFSTAKKIILDDSAQLVHMLKCKVLIEIHLIWRGAEMDNERGGRSKCPAAAVLK